MPATSPYQQNDYQAVSNYRPYQLPVNDIFKAISSQNEFWRSGTERVKSVHDNALNLSLTSTENKELRNKFMEDSDKELTRLSSKDLSDPSIQRQGFSIYKPLFQDEAIMQDDYLTKQYKDILNTAERYKNDEKTKGSGYNMDNLAYALKDFRNFNQKTSRSEIGNIYKKAKDAEYIPYYDVSKERNDILKNCKPNIFSNTTTQGEYLETEKISSLTSSKLYGCLEGGLSDQARQQIRISGVVRYGNDYQAVKDDYVSAAQDKSKYYKEQKASLITEKAVYAGKKGYEERVKQLDALIKQYDTGIEKADNDILTSQGWDEKYLEDNYETLASDAYFKRANHSFAEAFAREEVEKDKKANPIWMTEYVQGNLNKRQQWDFEHDKEMKDLDLRNKLLTGKNDDGTNMDPIARLKALKDIPGGSDLQQTLMSAVEEPGTNHDKIDKEIAGSDAKLNEIKSNIINYIGNHKDLGDLLTKVNINPSTPEGYAKMWTHLDNFIQDRLKIDPSDTVALELKDAQNSYLRESNRKTIYKSILDDSNKKLQESQEGKTLFQNYEKEKNNIFSRFNSDIKLNDGTIITPEIAKSIINGSNDRFKTVVISSPSSRDALKTNMASTVYPRSVGIKDMYTGKSYVNSDLFDARDNFLYLDRQKSTAYNNKLDSYLGQHTLVQKMGLSSGNLLGKGTIDQDREKMTPAMQQVSSLYGSTLGDVRFNTIGNVDLKDGWVEVQAVKFPGTSKEAPISADQLIDAAVGKGKAGASNVEKGNYKNSIRVKIDYLANIITEPTYADELRLSMNYLRSRIEEEGIKFPSNGVAIPVGITATGKTVSINARKSISNNSPRFSMMVNGEEISVPNPENTESVLSHVSKMLTGELNKQIK